jgi:hypothetical protein
MSCRTSANAIYLLTLEFVVCSSFHWQHHWPLAILKVRILSQGSGVDSPSPTPAAPPAGKGGLCNTTIHYLYITLTYPPRSFYVYRPLAYPARFLYIYRPYLPSCVFYIHVMCLVKNFADFRNKPKYIFHLCT